MTWGPIPCLMSSAPMRLRDLPDHVNEISGHVLDAAIKVHAVLGPGLLESTYKLCLAHELRKRGLTVEREVGMAVLYDDLVVPKAYFADILVANAVIVEAKTVDNLLPVHEAQLLTYMRWLQKPLGILLNFHAEKIATNGFRRLARSQSLRDDSASSAPPR